MTEPMLHPCSLKLDSTKITCLWRCPREFFFAHILGWSPLERNKDLLCGIAVHKAMDILSVSPSPVSDVPKAFAAYLKEHRKYYSELEDEALGPKGPTNIHKMLFQYVEKFRGEAFQPLHVETPGQLDLGEGRILYANLDLILEAKTEIAGIPGTAGQVLVMDHKTSSRDSDDFRKQFALSFQLGTYIHLLSSVFPDGKVWGAMVNGIILRKEQKEEPVLNPDGSPAIYKTGPKRGQPKMTKPSGKGNDFVRLPVMRNAEQQDAWFGDAVSAFAELDYYVRCLKSDSSGYSFMESFPRHTNACMRFAKPCPYHSVCVGCGNPLKVVERVGLDAAPDGYVKKYWDPETHTEVGLDGKAVEDTGEPVDDYATFFNQ